MPKIGLMSLGRRWVLDAGMRATLSLAGQFGSEGAAAMGSFVAGFAGWLPNLRRQLRANLNAAGVEATPERVNGYFRRLRCWAGWSAAVDAGGFVGSGIAAKISLDDSFTHLEAALAKGKGVILACPHLFCHELAAAAINQRYPVVALVRESKNPAREAMKAHWYEATGMRVVKRPRRASLVADTMSAIRALRGGAILGITPDVILPAAKGMAVEMLGQQVTLSPGIIMLSMRVGSPIILPWGQWTPGRTAREDRVTLGFAPPLEFPARRHSDADIRQGLQQWCSMCENKLRSNPDYWMFWLDKNWTKALARPAA